LQVCNNKKAIHTKTSDLLILLYYKLTHKLILEMKCTTGNRLELFEKFISIFTNQNVFSGSKKLIEREHRRGDTKLAMAMAGST